MNANIIGDVLYTNDPATTGLRVGSARWFSWLNACQGGASFGYEYIGLTFTARFQSQRHGLYWYAFKRVNGKLRSAYLGKPDMLTTERLRSAAEKLGG